jgi:hypothetical protein
VTLCAMCANGLTSLCQTGSCVYTTDDLNTKDSPSPINITEPKELSLNNGDDEEENSDSRFDSRFNGNSGRGSRVRGRSANYKDQQSTGRKYAARHFPLAKDQACEWQGQSNCGGGIYPIIGCIAGLQQARHHGPDKDVNNNESTNLHRICHFCHNRWHAANDPEYNWDRSSEYPPHNPRPMTSEEAQQSAFLSLKSIASKTKKIKD